MRPRSGSPARVAFLAAALLSSACAHRMMPPDLASSRVAGAPKVDNAHLALTIERFQVVHEEYKELEYHFDPDWDRLATQRYSARHLAREQALARAFADYLGNAAEYAAVTIAPEWAGAGADRIAGEPPRGVQAAAPVIPVEVDVLTQEDNQRTIILDVLFFYPGLGLFWPIAPEWGDARIALILTAHVPGSERPERFSVEVISPFSTIFYSWYRTEDKDRAFQRAYDFAFRRASERLAKYLAAALPKTQRRTLTATIAARPDLVATSTLALAQVATATLAMHVEPARGAIDVVSNKVPAEVLASLRQPDGKPDRLFLPEESGARVIVAGVRRQQSDSLLWRYLGALGGLELGYLRGGASVASAATRANGRVETVGAGEATEEGYRIAFWRPPDRTGFFFPPAFGFLSQDIEISGFRQAIPLSVINGVSDIPAIETDPTTGATLDIDEPIRYELRLKSAYVGQTVGLNLVLGSDDVQLFATGALAVNVIELRHADVTIYDHREQGFSLVGLRSGSVYGQIGLSVPALHFALRLEGDVEHYFQFDYPRPIDFMASVTWDARERRFTRERVFVTGASLDTWRWQLSATVLF